MHILVVLRLMRRNLISEIDIGSLIKHAMKIFVTGNSKFNCFKTCNLVTSYTAIATMIKLIADDKISLFQS